MSLGKMVISKWIKKNKKKNIPDIIKQFDAKDFEYSTSL